MVTISKMELMRYKVGQSALKDVWLEIASRWKIALIILTIITVLQPISKSSALIFDYLCIAYGVYRPLGVADYILKIVNDGCNWQAARCWLNSKEYKFDCNLQAAI